MRLSKGLIPSRLWLYAALLTASALIYGFYFWQLLSHLNTVLYRADGDSIKNYYTFAWHCRYDSDALQLEGLNYPYGEHIVYTDCQPLLSLILRLLPVGDGAIGILHGLILISFVVTPLVLLRILELLKIPSLPGSVFALAISLLSPQTHRLGGHFALAYGFVIPLAVLLFLLYIERRSFRYLMAIAVYNSLLFFIHPYLGLGCSALFVLLLACYRFFTAGQEKLSARLIPYLTGGALPIIAFRLFMVFTDHRNDRPTEPWGIDIMDGAANVESVFTPYFGPFDPFLKLFFKSKHVEWETWAYVGIAPQLFSLLLLAAFLFFRKRLKPGAVVSAMLISGILFLAFSFGIHNSILRKLHLETQLFNQFRVVGRFAWYFYFLLPLALVPMLYRLCQLLWERRSALLLSGMAVVYLSFCYIEGTAMFRFIMSKNFSTRNVFNAALLSPEERRLIARIDSARTQAILPLPLFHIGSEVYQRNGTRSEAPAMFYSYHCGLPVISDMLSRTSLKESEALIEVLNRYKTDRPFMKQVDERPFLAMVCDTLWEPDEERLAARLSPFASLNGTSFSLLHKQDLAISAAETSTYTIIDPSRPPEPLVWIDSAPRRPFTDTRIDDFSEMYVMEPNRFAPGPYVVSFHYHISEKKLRFIFSGLVVEQTYPLPLQWKYDAPIRVSSGFYGDIVVFEHRIVVEKDHRYRLMVHGKSREHYHISNLLIRPDSLNVKMNLKGKSYYNNYPE